MDGEWTGEFTRDSNAEDYPIRMSITEYGEISLISDTRNRLGFFVISKGKLLWLGASLGAMTLYEGKGTQNVQLAFFR
ncbi:MAG TPA: hypothetical protein DIT99_09535, partial [Candidatus Latescibacteria bacterium]|nr:hypothetical protein [Candidatus Latescibacterota bacterium]